MKINSLDELKIIDFPESESIDIDRKDSKIMYNNKMFIANISFELTKETKNDIIFEMELPFQVSATYYSPLELVIFDTVTTKRNPTVSIVIQDGKFRILSNDTITFDYYSPLKSFRYIGQIVGFIDN